MRRDIYEPSLAHHNQLKIGSVKIICQEILSAREAQFRGFAGPQKGSFPWGDTAVTKNAILRKSQFPQNSATLRILDFPQKLLNFSF